MIALAVQAEGASLSGEAHEEWKENLELVVKLELARMEEFRLKAERKLVEELDDFCNLSPFDRDWDSVCGEYR